MCAPPTVDEVRAEAARLAADDPDPEAGDLPVRDLHESAEARDRARRRWARLDIQMAELCDFASWDIDVLDAARYPVVEVGEPPSGASLIWGAHLNAKRRAEFLAQPDRQKADRLAREALSLSTRSRRSPAGAFDEWRSEIAAESGAPEVVQWCETRHFDMAREMLPMVSAAIQRRYRNSPYPGEVGPPTRDAEAARSLLDAWSASIHAGRRVSTP